MLVIDKTLRAKNSLLHLYQGAKTLSKRIEKCFINYIHHKRMQILVPSDSVVYIVLYLEKSTEYF